MANEMTAHTSSIGDDPNADESRENIPPRLTVAVGFPHLDSKVGDMTAFSSTQPSGGNEPLFDAFTFSTPAPSTGKSGPKTKLRLSGLQSALTPIIKHLNIDNECPTPEPKDGNCPNLKNSSIISGSPNCLKISVTSDKHPKNPSVLLLEDEYLPEMTFDVTCDSTMQRNGNDSAFPDSMPSTPVTKPVNNTFAACATLQPSQSKTSVNVTAEISCPQEIIKDSRDAPDQAATFTKLSPPKVCKAITDTIGNVKVIPAELSKLNETTSSPDSGTMMADPPESAFAPLRWLDGRYFPEITLLDVTQDSDFSPGGEQSSMEVTQDFSPVDSLKDSIAPSESCEKIVAESGTSNVNKNEELSRTLVGNVTQTLSSFTEQSDHVGGNATNTPLEATPSKQDISIDSLYENSSAPSEPSGQNEVKMQTSAEDTINNHPINLTHDIRSSELSSSDLQCKTSSKNITFELQAEPDVSSKAEESDVARCATNNVSQQSPKTAVNVTINLQQSSNLSTSTNLNTGAQISCPQNKTLDLTPASVSSPKVESEAVDQACSVSQDTGEMSHDRNQHCLAVKAGGSCDLQNATFERSPLENSISKTTSSDPGGDVQNATFTQDSLQKIGGNTILGEAVTLPQNNTFDTKPPSKQNDTIILSETISSSSHDGPMDIDSPPNTCDATSSSEVSLNFAADALITSTPMINCKIINFNHEQADDRTTAAQRKLCRDVPSKPDANVVSDIPSNIVSDRKTFLRQPAAKVMPLPPSKTASQLLKYKPTSTLPGKFEPLTSGLPMTRQRTQAEALRNAVVSEPPQAKTGISSCYNLRAGAATGSKQPNSGLRKPQMSSIPSGIQRAALGLRPPTARSNALASSNSDKLRGPTCTSNSVTNNVPKTSLAKKHPLNRSDGPSAAAKRKKMEAPLPPSSAEASASSCDATNRARGLKRPGFNHKAAPAKTQRVDAPVPASTAGCANCALLNQQLNIKSEEIRRLNEELLKYRKTEEGS